MTIREKISKLVEYSGGKVIDDRYVIEPGVALISKTVNLIPPKIKELFNLTDEEKQLAELNAKITYMNFGKTRDGYIEEIVNDRHEFSVLSNINLGFLVVGVKEETVLEFVSSIADISRQTTSRTRSADDTLYTVEEPDIQFIDMFLDIRESYLEKHPLLKNKDDIEKRNEFNLCQKAMGFTISMNLGNWISYVDRKLIQDYEYEFQSICQKIKELIKQEYLYIEFESDKEDIKKKIK